MAGKGFKEVYNLKGGIKAWKGYKAVGSFDMGIERIKGDEGPEDVIILAYGMEEGLREFYVRMSDSVEKTEAKRLFTKLADIEVIHKTSLFTLYTELYGKVEDQRTFEDNIVNDKMEGGFTTEQFINMYSHSLEDTEEILSIAMMLETQSLDLYLRLATKLAEQKAKDVLYELSEQEKGHLRLLGELLDNVG